MQSTTNGFQGNIVQTVRDGNTTIHICDDFCAGTPEEIEKVLAEYHAAGRRVLERLMQEG